MPKKKLLLISLSAGSGHVRAAEALKKTAELQFPSLQPIHIDLADYLSTTSRRIILTSYAFAATKVPSIWRFLYEHTNDAAGQELLDRITHLGADINAAKLYQYIDNLQPDYILNTHFLSAKLLFAREKKLSIPVSTLVTDYDIHEYWITEGVDKYFVGSEKIVWKLQKKHVAEERIIQSGIPVDPVFFEKKSVLKLKQKYNVSNKKPVILLLGGGQGMGRLEDALRVLFNLTHSCTIIAVVGKNQRLFTKLQSIKPPKHISFKLVGWTDQIDELMRIADIVVSKPGGLTTTECMTLCTWFIAATPIPGQEEVNAQFILDQHAGDVANTLDDLLYYVEQSLLHPKTPSTNITNGANIILNTITKQLQP